MKTLAVTPQQLEELYKTTGIKPPMSNPITGLKKPKSFEVMFQCVKDTTGWGTKGDVNTIPTIEAHSFSDAEKQAAKMKPLNWEITCIKLKENKVKEVVPETK